MAVRCGKCGEKLLGSVNRCWNCGEKFLGESGDGQLPPIRSEVKNPVPSFGQSGQTADTLRTVPTEGRSGQIRAKSNYPQNIFGENCAITSVVVGVMSLLGSVVTFWVAIPTTMGIILGAYGISSRRRRTAITGICLCSLTLVFVTSQALIGLYQQYQQQQQEIWDEF